MGRVKMNWNLKKIKPLLNILAGHICPDKYSLTSGERQMHFLGPGNE